MEIQKFISYISTWPTAVPPHSSTALDIIDELANHERRKRIIIYDLRTWVLKGDSDAFTVLCSSVYNSQPV